MRCPFIFKRPSDCTTKKIFITSLIMAVIAGGLVMADLEPFRQLDRIGYDLMVRNRAEKPANPKVLLVDIDEDSLLRYGQWPWPRRTIARLLDEIRKGEPDAVGVDILFAEQDRTSLELVSKSLKSDFNIDLDLSRFAPDIIDNDQALARSLGQGPFYLGVMFHFGEKGIIDPKLPDTAVRTVMVDRKNEQVTRYPVATGAVSTIPRLTNGAAGIGFVNVLPDADGLIRRAPLFISYNKTLYPSLALITCLHACKRETVVLESSPARGPAVRVGNTIIPTDRQGNIAIRFRGPARTYTTMSAADVLDGQLSPQIFAGKIVFVGASAEGLMDTHSTPFDRHFPGAEVHASVAGAILDHDFIAMPDWVVEAKGAVTFGAVILASLLILRFSTMAAGGILLLILFVFPLGALFVFDTYSIFISPASSVLVFVVSFSLVALARFRSEEILEMRRERELAAARDCALVGLASLAETRDNETGNHILRTQKYVKVLAEYLRHHRKSGLVLDPKDIDLLVKSSPLHDVGKVGVPDSILLKPGPLTAAEFEEMKKHTHYGAEALSKAESASGLMNSSSFLKIAREIALSHHEKWDGTGYPHGLKGAEIPLSGRLMAVADVYDALISKRVYKKAMSHEHAVRIIADSSGTHFDPEIVGAFQVLQEKFRAIAQKHKDEEK